MRNAIVIGNICSLLAMGFNSFSSTRKTPKGVLWMQNAAQAVYGVCGVLLKGYSATVQNVVSILRNCAAIWKIKSMILEWGLVILGVALGIVFNNRSWIGWLPILANLEYTLAIFRFKDDEYKIKIFFLISSVLFVIFNFAIQNYVGAAADIVVTITTIVVLLKKKLQKV